MTIIGLGVERFFYCLLSTPSLLRHLEDGVFDGDAGLVSNVRRPLRRGARRVPPRHQRRGACESRAHDSAHQTVFRHGAFKSFQEWMGVRPRRADGAAGAGIVRAASHRVHHFSNGSILMKPLVRGRV